MSNWIWLALLLVVIAGLFYKRTSLHIGTAITAVFLLVWTQSSLGAFGNVLVWTAFLAFAVVFNVPSLRRRWLSNRALSAFRGVMPKMSDTERVALEAGDVWWDGDLFSGKPDWQKLIDTRIPTLSQEEQAFLDGPVNELCDMLDEWNITHHEMDLPPHVWKFLKEQGFLGMIIPKKYGGKEFSAQAHSSVVVKISGRSTTAAVTVMVPNSLGPAELLMRYGTEQQREHYLPRLASGEEIPCFALTSPDAGSDAASMTDTGIVCRQKFDGQNDVLGIRLNWNKRYITLGPVATVLGLAFKLKDPEHLIGEKDDWGITCALIPTDTDGVTIGDRHFPLNSAFQNGPNQGKDVFIPVDWIIGGQEQAGQGWRMLMECLAAGRSISLPALSTGAGKLTSRATGAYARIRRQFNMPIGRFEGIEEPLARIAAMTYTMDATRTLTAGAIDLGHSPSVISAIAKYNLTEGMRKCVDDAMDIHGGSGICLGPNNFLARIYQSVPVSITVEGANILTRSLIIFGQGAIRCHPYVFKEMQAAMDSDDEKASIEFDQALWGHVGLTISNAVRTLVLGLTHSRFTHVPVSDPSTRYYQHLSRFSSAFALTADIAMLVLGGALKRKEKLSGRLADVLSQMYMMSAVLKRFHDQGQQTDDVPLLRWSCEHSLRTMQQSMDQFLANFPNRSVAWILRTMIFPYGKPFRGPSDQLGHQLANLLLSPSKARDRLTVGIYLPNLDDKQSTEPLAQ
ncbi:MAG: acyl-CoA dehydrogenase, partial [Thiohalomonadales bacterium]